MKERLSEHDPLCHLLFVQSAPSLARDRRKRAFGDFLVARYRRDAAGGRINHDNVAPVAAFRHDPAGLFEDFDDFFLSNQNHPRFSAYAYILRALSPAVKYKSYVLVKNKPLD